MPEEFHAQLDPPPARPLRAIEYFQQYYLQELLDYIAFQTNLYSIQSNHNLNVTGMDIRRLIGALLLMGVFGIPQIRMYWQELTRVPQIAEHIARDTFLDIFKHIHFNDNTFIVHNRENPSYDRLFKVRPLLDRIRSSCLLISQDEKQSIDEMMIPFKGQNKLKQYLPK